MSRIRFFILLVICSCFLSSADDFTYKWKMELPPDSGRFPERWVQGKWPMGIKPIVAHNGNLYIVGQKLTWISGDGVSWKAYPKTDWNERHGMSITFFKGKLWMMGGMKTWDRFHNDIWCSDDGLSWKLEKPHAEWSERRGHRVLVFGNKLWLFGGAISSGRINQTPTKFLNDVWTSDDGTYWTNVTKNANWPPSEPEITKFNNKLFMVVGEKNETWISENGERWTLLTDKPAWNARLNFGLLEYDNKLWFFGGREHNDVWSSNDGKNWIRESSPTPWSTRTAKHSIVFANKLWIYSGKTGREDSWSGEVWTMSK